MTGTTRPFHQLTIITINYTAVVPELTAQSLPLFEAFPGGLSLIILLTAPLQTHPFAHNRLICNRLSLTLNRAVAA